MRQRARVPIATPELDGHDIGVRAVERALRDAGIEVICPGLRQTPHQIAVASAPGPKPLAAGIGITRKSGDQAMPRFSTVPVLGFPGTGH